MKEKLSLFKEKWPYLLILVVLAILVAGFLIGFRLDNVEVEGLTYYEEEDFVGRINPDQRDRNSVLFFLKLRYGEKINLPFIQTTEVELKDAHTVHIRVYEKDIIGCIPYMGEYVCFDKDGIMVGSITELRPEVPLVTGLKYRRIVFNEKMDTEEENIFLRILNITQLIRKYGVKVQKICLLSGGEVNLEAGTITVQMGKHDQYDEQIAELPELLKKAEGLSGIFYMEDYTAGTGKVRFQQK